MYLCFPCFFAFFFFKAKNGFRVPPWPRGFENVYKSQPQLCQNLRLKMAEQLLLETNLSIDEISEEIGYQNKGYFYKIFMERYHITPAQFRKKELHS